MKTYYKMYLGTGGGFIPPRDIEFFVNGEERIKKTKPLIRQGRDSYEPLLIAEFTKNIFEGENLNRKHSDLQGRLMNFFQNFFLTSTGLEPQPFFITAPNPIDRTEKVIMKFSFDYKRVEPEATVETEE